MNRRWYLVAWDVDRADWRTFRVDRIEDPWTTRSRGPRHELPDGLDPVAFVERQTLAAAPTYRAVVTVEAPAAEVKRRMGEAAVEVEPLGDGRCRITTAEDTLPWLAIRLILLHEDFEVHEPPELLDYVGQTADRLRTAAAG
jgi:predicted DNA-binding transcriptional regulator YafY